MGMNNSFAGANVVRYQFWSLGRRVRESFSVKRWDGFPAREGHIIDKEEKLSGRVTGPKQLISFFPVTWITRRTWCRYTVLNFLLLSGPISTDFHNGSTYECTHLSPTLSCISLDPLHLRYPIRRTTIPYVLSLSARRNFTVSVILSRNANSRADNRAGTWLIFWFTPFIYSTARGFTAIAMLRISLTECEIIRRFLYLYSLRSLIPKQFLEYDILKARLAYFFFFQ